MGLVELVIAMAVLNVVILALFGAFNAGSLAVQRAARVSTAETLADKQLELYRALVYDSIRLNDGLVSSAGTDTTHTADAAWNGGSQLSASTCSATEAACQPVQSSVTGPDGRTYRIDTYARQLTSASGGPANGRDVKRVTVVVRQVSTGKILARLSTTFDKSTGCISPPNPC